MTATQLPIGALLFIFGVVALRDFLPSSYRALLSWLSLALAVAVASLCAGLAIRESFQRPFVFLFAASTVPLVFFLVTTIAIRIIEKRLNRTLVLMEKGGEDRFSSIAFIMIFALSAVAMAELMRQAA